MKPFLDRAEMAEVAEKFAGRPLLGLG